MKDIESGIIIGGVLYELGDTKTEDCGYSCALAEQCGNICDAETLCSLVSPTEFHEKEFVKKG